jgi:hypothetical protein
MLIGGKETAIHRVPPFAEKRQSTLDSLSILFGIN